MTTKLTSTSLHIPRTPTSTLPSRPFLQKALSVRFTAKDFVNHKLNAKLEDDYVLKDMIGEGAFGEVFACSHRATGSERAVKVIPKSKYDEDRNDEIRNEFRFVRSLNHPSIIKQYSLYESKTTFYIVTDIYKGGELMEVLEARERLAEEDAASLMNQLLSCVNYYHRQHGICHRDLKPENILLSGTKGCDDIKVIDWGCAAHYDASDEDAAPMTNIVGTPYYAAPQVLEGEYSNKCDIWSCGIIAYLVLSGGMPFEGETLQDIKDAVMMGEVVFDDADWTDVSDLAKDFVHHVLVYDEKDRPSAVDALQHPWLAQYRERNNVLFKNSKNGSKLATSSLHSMRKFDAGSKFKQATYALLFSQILTKEEKEEIDSVFRLMDADCSGTLTKNEVQDAFAEFYDKKLSDTQVDDLFEKVNISRSGAIEYSEFVCACLMEADLLDETRLRAAFQEFDLDDSGSISLDELVAMFSGLSNGTMDQGTIQAIMRQVDDNDDGEIDFDEFHKMMAPQARQSKFDDFNNLHSCDSFGGHDDGDIDDDGESGQNVLSPASFSPSPSRLQTGKLQ